MIQNVEICCIRCLYLRGYDWGWNSFSLKSLYMGHITAWCKIIWALDPILMLHSRLLLLIVLLIWMQIKWSTSSSIFYNKSHNLVLQLFIWPRSIIWCCWALLIMRIPYYIWLILWFTYIIYFYLSYYMTFIEELLHDNFVLILVYKAWFHYFLMGSTLRRVKLSLDNLWVLSRIRHSVDVLSEPLWN